MIKTNTPEHIMDLNIEDVLSAKSMKDLADKDTILNYVDDTHHLGSSKLPHPAIRAKMANLVMRNVLGLDLSPDYLLAAISKSHATLIIAPAGAGKSTLATFIGTEVKALRDPRIPRPLDTKYRAISKVYANVSKVTGKRILSIVYNKENVRDIQDKNLLMVAKVNNAIIPGFPELDPNINARTIHSICKEWVIDNAEDMKLKIKIPLLDGGALTKCMLDAIRATINRLGFEKIRQFSLGEKNPYSKLSDSDITRRLVSKTTAGKFFSLNTLAVETLVLDDIVSTELSIEEIESILQSFDAYYDINMPPEYVSEIIRSFRKYKKLKSGLDFSDYLYYAHKYLTSNPLSIRVANQLEFIIADEVQDYTPVMWELLRALNKKGVPLFAICDDDQAIYQFRGVSTEYMLNFKQYFDNSSVYTLTYNRRCRQRILEEANFFVTQIKNRFEKNTLSLKPGGEVEYIPYSNIESQMELLNMYLDKSDGDLSKKVLATRENFYTNYLASKFEAQNKPYRVLGSDSHYKPYSFEIHEDLMEIMNIALYPYDNIERITMYRISPVSKDEWFSIIGYDPTRHRVENINPIHLSELDYTSVINKKNMSDIIKYMLVLSDNINTLKMSEYMPTIINLYKKYYWDYHVKAMELHGVKEELFHELEAMAFNDLCKDITLAQYKDMVTIAREKYNTNCEYRQGIAMSTFHRLKGLEFEETIALFMDHDIFPNYDIPISQGVPEHVLQDLKDTDLRLWYVVITRSIDKFTAFYNSTNPSYFVSQRIKDSEDLIKTPVASDIDNILKNSYNGISSFSIGNTPSLSTESVAELFGLTANKPIPEIVEVPDSEIKTDLVVDLDIPEIDIPTPESYIKEVESFTNATDVITNTVKKAISAIKTQEESIEDLASIDENYTESCVEIDKENESCVKESNSAETNVSEDKDKEMSGKLNKNTETKTFDRGSYLNKLLNKLGE